jgi:hypothetical protein
VVVRRSRQGRPIGSATSHRPFLAFENRQALPRDPLKFGGLGRGDLPCRPRRRYGALEDVQITGRQGRNHARQRQGPIHRHAGLGRILQRPVPPIVGFFHPRRPQPARDRLDRNQGHALFGRQFHHRLAEADLEPLDEIQWEHAAVEGVALKRRQRRLGGVRGKSDPSHLARLLGLEHRFHRPARRQGLDDLVRPLQAVELVEVEITGLKPLQRALQLAAGIAGVVELGFGRQEISLARHSLQRDPELDFALAIPSVGWGHVEIIHPGIQRPPHRCRALGLIVVFQGEGRKANHRQRGPIQAQGPPWQRASGAGGGFIFGAGRRGQGAGARRGPHSGKKGSTFHLSRRAAGCKPPATTISAIPPARKPPIRIISSDSLLLLDIFQNNFWRLAPGKCLLMMPHGSSIGYHMSCRWRPPPICAGCCCRRCGA